MVPRSGERLGRLAHMFKDLTRVQEAQIRQSEAGRMELHVVRMPGYDSEDEALVRAETLKRVGTAVDFDIHYADSLPRTSSGKLRFVVSSLQSGKLD